MYALYNVGDTHEVDGVKCTIARVVLGDLELYRSQGWVDSIEDLGNPPVDTEKSDVDDGLSEIIDEYDQRISDLESLLESANLGAEAARAELAQSLEFSGLLSTANENLVSEVSALKDALEKLEKPEETTEKKSKSKQ